MTNTIQKILTVDHQTWGNRLGDVFKNIHLKTEQQLPLSNELLINTLLIQQRLELTY